MHTLIKATVSVLMCVPLLSNIISECFTNLRSNIKSVFTQATIFALAQSSIFYVYSAGFSVGAFQVISDSSSVYHADYEEIFRYIGIMM